MVDFLGVGGTVGVVLALTMAILLAIVPFIIAHALYQIGGALRLQAFLSKPPGTQWDPQWSEQAKKTPLLMIIAVVFLAVGVIVAIVVAGL